MLRVTRRQPGRQWRSLLWGVSLVFVAQGCSTFKDEKHSPAPMKVGTARVQSKDSSIDESAQPRPFKDNKQQLDQTSGRAESSFELTRKKPIAKSSSKTPLAIKTTAVGPLPSREFGERFDRSAKSEPAWTEHYDSAVWNGFGENQIPTMASPAISKSTPQILRTSASKSVPTKQRTSSFEDSNVMPASFVKSNFETQPTNAEVELDNEPPRSDARRRASTLNAISQYDDLRQIGFRRADEIVQAQYVVPDSEDTDPPPARPTPPRPARPVHIPLEGDDLTKDIQVTLRNGRVALVTRNAPVQSVLNLLAQQQGVNLITSEDVVTNISVSLSDVSFEDALSSIVAIAGCTWTEQKGIVLVTKSSTNSGSPDVTGRVLQVFPLNYVSAADVELTVKGLLTPMGQVFSTQMTPTDKRRTQEHIVVEDSPSSLARIAQLIGQLDQPPRQVMIQAHILQVELRDDTRHGINWENIISLSGGDLALSTVGFASAAASPASFLSFNGDRLDVLVEALKSTTDTKTLASPKIIVANGQEARIQIGERLGYFVTTTTQTSTLQNVNFLDTGVVMRVTPQISQDNRVLMTVRPEVSSGRITELGLPETQTTEANTTVLVEDGGGMVIGGLIKETDLDSQTKVPLLGDLWMVGRAFQRRSVSRVRSEIVIVLVPRIAPYKPDYSAVEESEVAKSQVKLFHGALQRENRPWEPKLPDAIENPRRLRVNRLESLFENPKYSDPKPLRYYFPTADEECPPGWVPGSYQEIPSVPPPEPVPPEPVIQTSDTQRESFPSATRIR